MISTSSVVYFTESEIQVASDEDEKTSNDAEDRALIAALMRLDAALEVAIGEAVQAFGGALAERLGGLVATSQDVAGLLALVPGSVPWSPLLRHPGSPKFALVEEGSRLTLLQRRFGLSGAEIDALLVACSPDLDQRYERLFGCLQDDLTRRRPTLATLVHLTAAEALPQWQGLVCFHHQSRLLQSGLISLHAESSRLSTTLGSRTVLPDEQLVLYLAGALRLDAELASFCTCHVAPTSIDHARESAACLQRYPGLRVVTAQTTLSSALRLHVHGDAQECDAVVRGVASACRVAVLEVDLVRLQEQSGGRVDDMQRLLLRATLAARLRDAALCLRTEVMDAHIAPAMLVAVSHLLTTAPLACLLTTRSAALPPDMQNQMSLHVAVHAAEAAERRRLWQTALSAASIEISEPVLAEVAHEFTLSPQQIARAAQAFADATPVPLSADASSSPSTTLFSCIRAQIARPLPRGVKPLTSAVSWSELILPSDTENQLHELCNHVRQRARVISDWGFAPLCRRACGVNVLFSGGSGTGKTTACEVLAQALDRPVLRSEVPQLVSKYIGETEKQLSEVFDAAEGSGALLVFDEADALFGKRTEVSDAHDRYANIEVSYLLQRIEEFSGVLILTTNLQANIDPAFLRRMQFVIEFTFPDAAQRERIWRVMLPAQAPKDDDLDLAQLAQRYPLAGGNIRNIAMAAAVLAAGEGTAIAMRHIAHAAHREYQKIGKTFPDGGFFGCRSAGTLGGIA